MLKCSEMLQCSDEVSKSVVKCSWVKCSEVLQCSDGLSSKVSDIIRRHTDKMKLLFVCILGSVFLLMYMLFYSV